MVHIRHIAIGIALSVLAAGLVALTIPSAEPVATVVPAPRPVHRARPPAPPPAGGAAPQPAAEASWRDMHAAYLRAQSLRAFFHEAVASPASGGYYYAMKALGACRTAHTGPAPGLAGPRRQAALELQRRCDFTEQDLEDAEREFSAIRNLDYMSDPLLGSMFSFLSAPDRQTAASLLRQAFDQGHPDVIASLVSPAMQRDGAAAPGQRDATSDGLPFAALLVACRLGADCGPGALRTMELCAELGWCGQSVAAALQQGLGGAFARVDALAAGAVEDIRRRETRRLMRLR